MECQQEHQRVISKRERRVAVFQQQRHLALCHGVISPPVPRRRGGATAIPAADNPVRACRLILSTAAATPTTAATRRLAFNSI